MLSDDSQNGGEITFDEPDWRPLVNLAPEHVEDFMWMYATELEDGATLHAYKHWWTRCYVFLDRAGRAFAYTERGRYRQGEPLRLLDEALAGDPELVEPRYIVRHNALCDYKGIEWARSATKHRISRRRSKYVLTHQSIHLLEGPKSSASHRRDPRIVFLGDDQDGTPLEVMAILLDGGMLLVIHAMPLRDRYRPTYEEASGWRR